MRRGHTVVEQLFALTITSMVVAGTFPLYLMFRYTWGDASTEVVAGRSASVAIGKIVYGNGKNAGLRGAVASTVITNASGAWDLWYTDVDGMTNHVAYDPDEQTIRSSPNNSIVCDSVVSASVQESPGGILLGVSVYEEQGRFNAQSDMSTFVSFRNQ